MRVFEVITERCADNSKEIVEIRQYVTSKQDTLKSVTDYYTQHCHDYELELKSVREILTIIQHIEI